MSDLRQIFFGVERMDVLPWIEVVHYSSFDVGVDTRGIAWRGEGIGTGELSKGNHILYLIASHSPRPEQARRSLADSKRAIRVLVLFLLPSYITRHFINSALSARTEKALPATAFLDGLKGIFALIVFIEHFSLPWQKGIYHGYGEGTNWSLLQLPIIRAL